MNRLSTEDIGALIESQLEVWPEAAANFGNIRQVERRIVSVGDLKGGVQFNPARIRSTGAAVDAASLAARPCFLCRANRPPEQFSAEWIPGWELLVNPYPILPVHFTVVDVAHTPQGGIPLEMAAMAELAPDLAIFFNGAKAGASAPDHRHVQAVLKSELPLLTITESCHLAERKGWMTSEEFGLDLPFQFLSAVITPDGEGQRALSKCMGAYGVDASAGLPDKGLVNSFMWIGHDGLLRIIIVPRRAHRPSDYYAPEGKRLLVSPGAIDMAGLLILPRREDYDKIKAEDIRRIYSEVAFADRLPEPMSEFFLR